MASTNKTSNLELSQFIATDTPTWLVDYNGDMEKIDAGVGRVEQLAETASTQAVGAASGLQATNQNVTTLSGQVANVQNQANTTTASVNGINQRLGNADISGIADGTITGAISVQNSDLESLKTVAKYTVITGNLTTVGAGVVIPYPDGYSVDNIIPVSVFWSYSGAWTNANTEIQLYTDNIGIVCRDSNSANAPFRLAITKK